MRQQQNLVIPKPARPIRPELKESPDQHSNTPEPAINPLTNKPKGRIPIRTYAANSKTTDISRQPAPNKTKATPG
jgi:hypothetical protein